MVRVTRKSAKKKYAQVRTALDDLSGDDTDELYEEEMAPFRRDLRVDEAYQRRGIGRALSEEVERRCAARGRPAR